MNSFLKNFMRVATTALIFAVPVLTTMSFCLEWEWLEILQALFVVMSIFDFIVVLFLVIYFYED